MNGEALLADFRSVRTSRLVGIPASERPFNLLTEDWSINPDLQHFSSHSYLEGKLLEVSPSSKVKAAEPRCSLTVRAASALTQ